MTIEGGHHGGSRNGADAGIEKQGAEGNKAVFEPDLGTIKSKLNPEYARELNEGGMKAAAAAAQGPDALQSALQQLVDKGKGTPEESSAIMQGLGAGLQLEGNLLLGGSAGRGPKGFSEGLSYRDASGSSFRVDLNTSNDTHKTTVKVEKQ